MSAEIIQFPSSSMSAYLIDEGSPELEDCDCYICNLCFLEAYVVIAVKVGDELVLFACIQCVNMMSEALAH